MMVACLGGTSSNIIALLAKVDLSLSVSLTAINSLITIFTIPLIINFSFAYFNSEVGSIPTPEKDIFISLVAVIAIPLTSGMFLKKKAPNFALKMEGPVRVTSSLLLALVIITILVKEFELFKLHIGATLWILIALNAITMTLGYVGSRWLNLNLKQAVTVAIESGIQNGTLTISLAVITLAHPEYTIVAAIDASLMYLMASVPIAIGVWDSKK